MILGSPVSSKPKDKCLYKRKAEGDLRLTREAKTHRESTVKTETEIRVVQLQVRECLEPPEAGRHKEGFSPRASRWSGTPLTLIGTSGLPHRERINFCFFKSSSL